MWEEVERSVEKQKEVDHKQKVKFMHLSNLFLKRIEESKQIQGGQKASMYACERLHNFIVIIKVASSFFQYPSKTKYFTRCRLY